MYSEIIMTFSLLYTPCYLCDGVVRVGSKRFAVLEPPRSSA